MSGTKKVIFVADDLGISEKINLGIVDVLDRGIVKSTSLLINAPATNHAIKSIENKDVEVGLHLAFVESYPIDINHTSLLDKHRYFTNGACLINSWDKFCIKLIRKQINLHELIDSLELQIQKFLKYFGNIPFINSTQHLHALPPINDIVIDLSQKYNIPYIRQYDHCFRDLLSRRGVPRYLLGIFCKHMTKKLRSIKYAGRFEGFGLSGNMSIENIKKSLVQNGHDKVIEIMVHPGLDDDCLRHNKHLGFKNYKWQMERETLLSDEFSYYLTQNNIEPIRVADFLRYVVK